MVKGVNKTIIEINNTGSKYFDRVLLFVNPEHASVPMPLLEHKAEEIIKKAGIPAFSVCGRKRRRRRKALLCIAAVCIVAAVICLFILK